MWKKIDVVLKTILCMLWGFLAGLYFAQGDKVNCIILFICSSLNGLMITLEYFLVTKDK